MSTLNTWLPRENLRGSPSRIPTRVPSGTIWPHDEFTLGYAKQRPDGGPWHEDPFVGMGVDDAAMEMRAREGLVPLDLSDVLNSTKKAKRGLKGISGYGRNMVKAVGALVNRNYPHHRVTFCTVTLPEMSTENRLWVAENWAELTRELLRWVTRQLEKAGVPAIVCSVSEIQPKRLATSGSGYLHWHLIWLNVPAKSGSWSIEPNDLRKWLSRVLDRKLNTNLDGGVNVDVRSVKGEVARYMAKYMSKGSETLAEAQEDWGEGVTPATWWNMNAKTRAWVKANTFKGVRVGQLLESVLDYIWETGETDPIEFIKPIELEYDGITMVVGWRGRFGRTHADDLRGMIKSAYADLETLG